MKIILATWMEDNQGVTLTKAGMMNRLLSYYFLKQQKMVNIKTYVVGGIFKKK